MFGKVVYGIVPYIALAFFLTVLTRSTGLGISLAIGYIFSEAIIISFLGYRFEGDSWFQSLLDFMPWPRRLRLAGGGGSAGSRGGLRLLPPGQSAEQHLRAFLVILAYTAVLGGAASPALSASGRNLCKERLSSSSSHLNYGNVR